jgi:hypothetical protein
MSQKVSALTALAGADVATGDELYINDDGTGSKKIEAGELAEALGRLGFPVASVQADGLQVATSTPASASATGTAGTISWDADYIYICTATNTWKRVAIASW